MKKALLVLVAIGTLSFYSCKKYEEGPLISLRSVEKRLVGECKLLPMQ